MLRRRATAGLALLVATSGLVTAWDASPVKASSPAAPVVTNYTGTGISGPAGITTGPDGALWFANYAGNSIGRITTDGSVTNFTGTGVSEPDAIVAGPDGAFWFTNYGGNSIGRITTDGTVTNYTGTGISSPGGIKVGPDGALWFTNVGGSIGRITTDGTVSNFTGVGMSNPDYIAAGSDGAMWFTNWGNGSIGRITTDGTVSNFTGTGISSPNGITSGPDGAMWFTNYGNGSIGRIGTDGTVTNYADPSIAGPVYITVGSDGALWFANSENNSIGRITTSGTITNYTDASIAGPGGITSGPDGALWFTNFSNDSIGRISTVGATMPLSSLTASVGRSTPLWKLTLSTRFTPQVCQSALHLDVSIAGKPPAVHALCAVGVELPASVVTQYPVFASGYTLQPNTTYAATASIPELGQSISEKIRTPKPPIWIAAGDSFSSGHHQVHDEPLCVAASDRNTALYAFFRRASCVNSSSPSVVPNDASFAWGSAAVSRLNSQHDVPQAWRMTLSTSLDPATGLRVDTARSGAATTTFGSAAGPVGSSAWAASGTQAGAVRVLLAARPTSWNVFSVTGGADDIRFADALVGYYAQNAFYARAGEPWAESARARCPNTDLLYSRLRSTHGSWTPLASQITRDLDGMFTVARQQSPGVRVVDVSYPFVTNPSSACAGDAPSSAPVHGSDTIVLLLQQLHANADRSASGVIGVNLTTTFGSRNPVAFLQTQRYYGYPHPNASGQSAIATAVDDLLH